MNPFARFLNHVFTLAADVVIYPTTPLVKQRFKMKAHETLSILGLLIELNNDKFESLDDIQGTVLEKFMSDVGVDDVANFRRFLKSADDRVFGFLCERFSSPPSWNRLIQKVKFRRMQ